MGRLAEKTGQLVGIVGFEADQFVQMVDQTGQWVGLTERKAD